MENEHNGEMEFLDKLLELSEDMPATHEYIKTFNEDEMGSFLFFGEGPDIAIQGMHYPDDALDLSKIPNIFPSSEPNKIIAAFPRSVVEKMAALISENYEEEYHDTVWKKMLGLMLEASIDALDGNGMPSFDVEKLL